jgi:hypothetical protein
MPEEERSRLMKESSFSSVVAQMRALEAHGLIHKGRMWENAARYNNTIEVNERFCKVLSANCR